MLQDSVVVPVAVRSVTAAHAPVVAEERDASVGRATHRFLEDLHAVTDVALDVEQVRRSAARLTTVDGHYLNQPARADRAAGVRVKRVVFGQQNADEQRRIDLLLV